MNPTSVAVFLDICTSMNYLLSSETLLSKGLIEHFVIFNWSFLLPPYTELSLFCLSLDFMKKEDHQDRYQHDRDCSGNRSGKLHIL